MQYVPAGNGYLLKKAGIKRLQGIANIMKMIEAEEQAALFRWAEAFKDDYPDLELLNGSLNGVRLTMSQAVKAKKAGMKKGFPDINLPVARGGYHGLYVELKIKPYQNDKGKMVYPSVSVEQLWWLDRLREYGYRAVICKGFDEAKAVIIEYLGKANQNYERT